MQGDRERITVFGPGAGAASAGLLAVMPKTRSMVRRVIAMSGSPLADWAAINDKFRHVFFGGTRFLNLAGLFFDYLCPHPHL